MKKTVYFILVGMSLLVFQAWPENIFAHGTISGRVTDTSNAGIENILVQALLTDFDDITWVAGSGYTDASGNYTISLNADSYQINFSGNGLNYISACYRKYGECAWVPVYEGNETPNIDAQLIVGGQISGKITDVSAVGIQNIKIYVSDLAGNLCSSGISDANGNYTVSCLPSGNLKVQFHGNGQDYVSEYYNDKYSSQTADPVAVTAGNVTPNINAQLSAGGKISGRVTDTSGVGIAGLGVVAEGTVYFYLAITDDNGYYTISDLTIPLATGNYLVAFNTFYKKNCYYSPEWFNNKKSYQSADLVAVTAGSTTANIDAQLEVEPARSITVTSPNGGEIWTTGESHEISWTTTGNIPLVYIRYSINNGVHWRNLDSFIANDGSYSWTIPDEPSSTCLVRVTRDNTSCGIISDTSDAVFTIMAPIETVSVPNTPVGPSSGVKNTGYSFSTGGSTSSLGHAVQYKFDWDDGSDSGWLAEGTTQASHSWAAAGTYNIRAMARCATHTTLESLWSATHAVTITDGGTTGYYNSPASRLIISEANWSTNWTSDVQITDVSGGSVVQVYYNIGVNRRGPFTLWTNSGGAGRSVFYSNILQTIDGLDSGSFTYWGAQGTLEFITQDGSHLIQGAVRTYNGNASRTFPAFADVETNTAAVGRDLLIPNISNDATYRPSLVLFNPGTESVTLEARIIGSNGAQVGSTINRTLAAYQMDVVTTEVRADTYSNANIIVTVPSGTGRVLASGQTANNVSNDPAAHLAMQMSGGYANSPEQKKILAEVNWSANWTSEVQIIDVSGGSVVQVYYNSDADRRGPFTLWTNSGGAGCSVFFNNILQTIDGLDSGSFTYWGTQGTLELITQNSSHLVQAAVRTFNGNYSRTFPAFGENGANTAALGRALLIPDVSNDTSYRPSVVLFNPTADSVTVEGRIIGSDGAQIGATFTRTLAGHEMSVISTEVRVDTYSNADIMITVTAGTGTVLVSGQTANNVSNDPAAHIAVQGQ